MNDMGYKTPLVDTRDEETDKHSSIDNHAGRSRRGLLRIGCAGAAAALLAGCAADNRLGKPIVTDIASEKQRDGGRLNARPHIASPEAHKAGRLGARPHQSPTGRPVFGLHALGLGDRRDGLLYVPRTYRRDQPMPLVLMLHGANGNARGGMAPFLDRADDAGVILLSIDSRGRTWDVIVGGYGPDTAFIDRALHQTFTRYAIDADRVGVEGFSDGASYAVSLGITNGDLFTHVIAFSPGFAAPGEPHGSPRFFVTHGTQDHVLPINSTSRKLVPALRRAGYDVRYEEFNDGHRPMPELTQQALVWFKAG